MGRAASTRRRSAQAAQPRSPLERDRLRFRQHGVEVELVTGHGVFSAAAVDPGTRFLLRWLAESPHVEGTRRVLDLGCGYGPFALWLAAADPARTVLAVDRDAGALACTRWGAEANGLAARVAVAPSLGYDDLDREDRFDLVVSNVPAKVGQAARSHLLFDSWWHLAPGGRVAVVVVDRLAGPVGEALAAEPAVEVLEHHANRGYACWIWRFRDRPSAAEPGAGFDRGAYRRGSGRFAAGRLAWSATTSTTIPEFDTLNRATVALARLLAAGPPAGPVAVVGVGQGHGALALRAAAGQPVPVRLVDRDLLALRTAAANLGGGAVEVRHTAHPAEAVDGCRSAIVTLPEKEPVSLTADLLAPALTRLGPGATVLLAGRSVDVARVLELLARRGCPLEVQRRQAVAGHAAVRARATVAPPG